MDPEILETLPSGIRIRHSETDEVCVVETGACPTLGGLTKVEVRGSNGKIRMLNVGEIKDWELAPIATVHGDGPAEP